MTTPLIETIARAIIEAQGYSPSENELARARDEVPGIITALTEAGYQISKVDSDVIETVAPGGRQPSQLPDLEALTSRFEYNPETGVLTHKLRPRAEFCDDRSYGTWLSRFHGKAITRKTGAGYVQCQVGAKSYFAHRVIWKIVHGVDPKGHIDHINGNRSDNRIVNLRCVSNHENQKNRRIQRNNTTGHVGVYFNDKSPDNPWVAKIMVDGKSITLGAFPTVEQAVAVRKEAESQHGFHPNHGATAALDSEKGE